MSQKIVDVLIISIFVAIMACTGSHSTAPSGYNEIEPLVTITIGTEGGTVETDGFLLTIPQGAFDDSNEISVYSDTAYSEFGSGRATKPYQIQGLPETYDKPLRLALAYEGTLSNKTCIAYSIMMEDVLEVDTTTFTFLLNAQDSSNYLICYLESKTGLIGSKRSNSNLILDEDNAWDPWKALLTEGITDLMETESGNVKITYRSFLHSKIGTAVNLLNSHLDKIMNDLNFDPHEVGWNFPIEVLVRKRGNNRFPVSISNIEGEVKMNIDNWLIHSESYFPLFSLRAGRYLLGRVLLDYADVLTIDNLWLITAVEEWSEEIFTLQSDYEQPSGFWHDTIMAPFKGMRAGVGENEYMAKMHGQGMASVIKYLLDDERYGVPGMVRTFEDMWGGESSVGAIVNNMQALVTEWWPEFFIQYVGGNIYNVSSSEFMKEENIARTWNVDENSEMSKTFTSADVGTYPDLSAKSFLINLNNQNFEDDDSLFINVDGEQTDDGLAAVAFILKDDKLEYINHKNAIAGELEIPGLKSYVENNWNQILMVVVNSILYPPYTGTSDIDVTMRIGSKMPDDEMPEVPYHCLLEIDVVKYYQYTSAGTTYVQPSELNLGPACDGSLSGNIFTANYSYIIGEDLLVTGTVLATFDSAKTEITSLTWDEQQLPGSANYTRTISLDAVNIPYSGLDKTYWINDEETCDHIVTFTDTQVTSGEGLSFSIQSYECTIDSYIQAAFTEID